MKKTALIAGSTGLVGQELLQLLLTSKHYEKVICLNRKPQNILNPKLEELIFSFEDAEAYKNLPEADDVFCCLGTTIKKAGSQKAFQQVDYQYPLNLAEAMIKKGAKNFHVVTAMGADANSSVFYNKVKGALEDALKKLTFEQVFIYRPSLLVGDRKENRFGEKLAIFIMPKFEFLLQGSLKKYRSIAVKDVAKAMLVVAEKNTPKQNIFLSNEIQDLANSYPSI